MSVDRERECLTVQGQGGEAIVQPLRSRPHTVKQSREMRAYVTDPLLFEACSLPLSTCAPSVIRREFERRSRIASA